MSLQHYAKEFVAGATSPLRGVTIIFRHPSLLLYGITPLLLGLLWGIFSLLQWSLPAAETAAWYITPVHWLVNLNIIIVIVLIAITSPLLDFVGLKLEECCKLRMRARRLPRLGDAKYLAFMLGEAGRLFLIKTAVLLVALAISQIPGPGKWIGSLLVGLTIALDFLDYPLTRRRYNTSKKRDWLKQHWPAALGFCLVGWLLFITPGLGGLMLLPLTLAGTLLVVPDRLK